MKDGPDITRGVARALFHTRSPEEFRFEKLEEPLLINLSRVGDGKTKDMLDRIVSDLERRPDERICVLAPTVALCMDLKARLEARDIDDAEVWLGADQTKWDPEAGKDVPICKIADKRKAVSMAGGDPAYSCKTCPHADTCPLYLQRLNVPRVQIAAHAMMHHPMPGRGDFDLVIYDEDFINTLTPTRLIPLHDLTPEVATEAAMTAVNITTDEEGKPLTKGPPGSELNDVQDRLMRAGIMAFREQRALKRSELPSEGELYSLYRTYQRLLKRPKLPFDKGLPKGIERQQQLHSTVQFLEALLRAMTNSTCGSVPGTDAGKRPHGRAVYPSVEVTVLTPPHESYRTPSLLLSATAQPNLYEDVYKEVQHMRKDPLEAHHRRVIHIDHSGSKTSLVGADGSETKPTLRDVAAFANALGRRHLNEARGSEWDLFIACQRPVEEKLRPLLDPDLRIDVGHFNALEGINRYEKVRAQLIVGRVFPQPASLKLQAEALVGRSIEVPQFWSRVPATATALDGTEIKLMDYVHPEEDVMSYLFRATCHAQLRQADRTRGQHREHTDPVDLYIMSTLPTEYTYDTSIPFGAIQSWHVPLMAMGVARDPDKPRGYAQLIEHMAGVTYDTAKKQVQHHPQSPIPVPDSWQKIKVRMPGKKQETVLLIDEPPEIKVPMLIEKGVLPEGTTWRNTRKRRPR